jgi:hypothetical protein
MGCELLKTYKGLECANASHPPGQLAGEGTSCSYGGDAGVPDTGVRDAAHDTGAHDAAHDAARDTGTPACSCDTPGYCASDGGMLCACDLSTQYCDIIVSAADGGPSTPVCVALPAACVDSPNCGCVQGDSGECADICGTVTVILHQ